LCGQFSRVVCAGVVSCLHCYTVVYWCRCYAVVCAGVPGCLHCYTVVCAGSLCSGMSWWR